MSKNFEFNISEFNKLHKVAKDLPYILLYKVKKISVKSVLSKIFVSKPYFAFRKIYQFNNILIAPIEVQQDINFESSPIGSAEASRHLAILGASALGISQQERKYYLATRARKRATNGIEYNKFFHNSRPLYALAMPLFIEGKIASSITLICTIDGDIIFNFKVGYQVFTEKLFGRVFQKHTQLTQNIEYSPYRDIPSFKDIIIDNNILQAVLPTISKLQCAGHFNNYPILPVGVLAYMSIHTLKEFLDNITKNNCLRYCLSFAEMDVLAPTSINEEAKLIINYCGEVNNEYKFSWVMKNYDDEILNTMTISFIMTHEITSISKVNTFKKTTMELEKYKTMYAELAYLHREKTN
jgi:hypothetical protein